MQLSVSFWLALHKAHMQKSTTLLKILLFLQSSSPHPRKEKTQEATRKKTWKIAFHAAQKALKNFFFFAVLSRACQTAAKMLSGGPSEEPVGSQNEPKSTPTHTPSSTFSASGRLWSPKRRQDPSKRAPRGPKRPKRRPKDAPRGPKETQKRPQEASGLHFDPILAHILDLFLSLLCAVLSHLSGA